MADDDYSDSTDAGGGDEAADGGAQWVEDAKVGDVQDIMPDGGIKKECLVEGEGDQRPPRGAKVQVHYVGTLVSDGSKFDSSRDRGDPFEFKIGEGQVIKGWDKGVATMRKGEKSILTCTAPYAYGESGSPPAIPGGATLRFEVELFGWELREDVSKDGDKSIMKNILKSAPPDIWEKPEYETECCIDITGPGYNKQDWKVIIGDEMVPPGLETCLESMKKGEEADVLIEAQHLGDGDWGKVPVEGSEATYKIVMKEFEKPTSRWSLKADEKIEAARKRKDEGNALYKAQKLQRAMRKYKKAEEIAGDDYNCSEEEKKQMKELKLPCLTNLAAVELALKEYKDCIEHCGKALEVDGACVKALVRRAKAYNALEDWAACRADLDRVVGAGGLDEGNADAKRELEKLKKKTKAQDAKDRATFSNMFSKMSKMEQKEKRAARAAGDAEAKPSEEAGGAADAAADDRTPAAADADAAAVETEKP